MTDSKYARAARIGRSIGAEGTERSWQAIAIGAGDLGEIRRTGGGCSRRAIGVANEDVYFLFIGRTCTGVRKGLGIHRKVTHSRSLRPIRHIKKRLKILVSRVRFTPMTAIRSEVTAKTRRPPCHCRANRAVRGKRNGLPRSNFAEACALASRRRKANRAEFMSMRVDEFSWYSEGASQFTDSHERIVVGIDHILQPRRLSPSNRSVDLRDLQTTPRARRVA
jgi:hypothetical protein